MYRLPLLLGLLTTVAGCARPRLGGNPGPGELPVPAGMSAQVWHHALTAYARVKDEGVPVRPVLAVIDYSLPSSEPRLWVTDLNTGALLLNDYVAHGWASGGTWPTRFSNRRGSNQSSLGAFVAGEAYVGVRGLSLRLSGLEPGINDRARERGIVIHGSPSVSSRRAGEGNVGRTEGCPAVPMPSARTVVRLLEGGGLVYAWYPDPAFLATSRYLSPLAWAGSP